MSLRFTLVELWGLFFIMPQGGVDSQGLVAGVGALRWVLGWFKFGLQASIATVNQLSVGIIGLLYMMNLFH